MKNGHCIGKTMKKKVLSILLCVALTAGILFTNQSIKAEEKESLDTTSDLESVDYSDYEEIKTPADMDKLSYVVDGKYYLSADIDMSQYEGTYKPVTGFKGVLDGRGHVIKNLRTAVIDTIVGNATVRDVKIEGAYREDSHAGLLVNEISLSSSAGEAEVLIENVETEGKIANNEDSGGICHYASTGKSGQKIAIRNCCCKIEIDSFGEIGGIVGHADAIANSAISISKCASLSMTKEGTRVGGIVGWLRNTKIENCYSNMTIDSSNYDPSSVGGIIGYSSGTSTIQNCLSDCYVSGTYAGGLVGRNNGSLSINSSVSLAEKIKGRYSVGAVIGEENGTTTLDKVFTYSKLYDEVNRTYLTDQQATALTAMQLTEESAFSGLDFESTFACVPGVNRDRILLKQLAEYFTTDAPIIEVENTTANSKTVTMRSMSEDAKIYFTNGAGPATIESTLYSDPIVVDQNTYFNAIAIVDGYGASVPQEAQAEFKVEAPAASIEQGTYQNAISVDLTCNTEGATIYYTTDGTTPTTRSTLYTGTPISFESNGVYTINAIAVKSGWTSSDELVKKYEINIPPVIPDDPINTNIGNGSTVENTTDNSSIGNDSTVENTMDNSSTKVATITKPSKVTGVKVKKKNTKQITSKSRYNLSWGKVKGVDGYEIQGYVSSVYRHTFITKNLKIKTIKKNSLKNQRIYWLKIYPNAPEENIVSKVRVRAYKVINGKRVYGRYSSWKTILPSKQVKKWQREST